PHSQNSQSLRGSVQQRFIPNAARKSLGSPRQRGILAALGIKRYSLALRKIEIMIKPTLVFVTRMLAIAFTSCASWVMAASTVDYTESDANFPNPERGFYRHRESSSSEPKPLTIHDLKKVREDESISHIYFGVYLDTFKTSPISEEYLALIDKDFNTIRGSGLKMILRFAYTHDMKKKDDAPLDQVLVHLQQLTPLLKRHADVIEVVQAGIIGAWGEWHSSKNFGSGSARRKTLVQALLKAVPEPLFVQLRTPAYKQVIFGVAGLTAEKAFSGSDIARVGFHNDAFCATENDMGTFNNDSERTYMQSETRFVPMGGETCAHNPKYSCWEIASEAMAAYHMSYLNAGYHPKVLASWDKNIEIARRKLGYRFVLKTSTASTAIPHGGAMDFRLSFVNVGYAAPFNRRECDLILRDKARGKIHRVPLRVDPRRWLPGPHEIKEQIDLKTVPRGRYELLLHLGDPSRSLNARPEYAIRLANDKVWEPDTGFNKLLQTIEIR
ncbi:MAG: DUF4832 domain-containing protein, partial [Verrucomicrobia bacterium]|nr:DUF4832 domain-containing protein [Verrucomicrobiota bacterium]